MRELGNPFTETKGELLRIISKTIMAKESEETSMTTISWHESLNTKVLSMKK